MLYKKNPGLLRQTNQERHRQGGPQIMAITIIGEALITISWGSPVAFEELHYCRDALLCIRHYQYNFRGRLRRLPGDSLSR